MLYAVIASIAAIGALRVTIAQLFPVHVPTLLNTWECRETRPPFDTRCSSAEYYYSIESVKLQHGSGCDPTSDADAIKQQIDTLCAKAGVPDDCSLTIFASNSGELRKHTFEEFTKRADEWKMIKKIGASGEIFWEQESSDLVKGKLKFRKMVDKNSVPNSCAMLYTAYKESAFQPKDLADENVPVNTAQSLVLPPCRDYSTLQSVPEYPVRRAKICDSPNEILCDDEPSSLCISVVYTIPVITNGNSGDKLCLPSKLFGNTGSCELTSDLKVLAKSLGEAFYPGRLPELQITASNPQRTTGVSKESVYSNYRCNSALYYYGVVSGEIRCEGSCQDSSTKSCTSDVMKKVCGEDAKCKFTPRVAVLAHYEDEKTGESRAVPWHLEWDGTKGYHYKTVTDKKQYLYEVRDDRVGTQYCATLNIEVKKRLTDSVDRVNEPNYETVYPWQEVSLPQPWWNDTIDAMGNFAEFPINFEAEKTCGTSSGKIGLRLNLVLMYGELYDPFSRKVCKETTTWHCNVNIAEEKIKTAALTKVRQMVGGTDVSGIDKSSHDRWAYEKQEYRKMLSHMSAASSSREKQICVNVAYGQRVCRPA